MVIVPLDGVAEPESALKVSATALEADIVTVPPRLTGEPLTLIPLPADTVMEELARELLGILAVERESVPPNATGDPETDTPAVPLTVIESLTRAALGTCPKLGAEAVLPKRTVLLAPTAKELKAPEAEPICTAFWVVPTRVKVTVDPDPAVLILPEPVSVNAPAEGVAVPELVGNEAAVLPEAAIDIVPGPLVILIPEPGVILAATGASPAEPMSSCPEPRTVDTKRVPSK
jgi:hypothetical protein